MKWILLLSIVLVAVSFWLVPQRTADAVAMSLLMQIFVGIKKFHEWLWKDPEKPNS